MIEPLVAMLCDFANARDGLINIIGGGITTVRRTVYPDHLNAAYVALLQGTLTDFVGAPPIAVIFLDKNGSAMFRTELDPKQGEPPASDPEGAIYTAPILLDAHRVVLPEAGQYSIQLWVGDSLTNTARFLAVVDPSVGQ
jgi:hypothetical protein